LRTDYADKGWLQPSGEKHGVITRVLTFASFVFAAAFGYVAVIFLMSLK
jgi:hypothetical protein